MRSVLVSCPYPGPLSTCCRQLRPPLLNNSRVIRRVGARPSRTVDSATGKRPTLNSIASPCGPPRYRVRAPQRITAAAWTAGSAMSSSAINWPRALGDDDFIEPHRRNVFRIFRCCYRGAGTLMSLAARCNASLPANR